MEKAAKRGVERVEEFWALTPREVMCRIKSAGAKKGSMDLLAWIMARYITLAVHAPDKLPPLPSFFPEERESMTAEQMKARFDAFRG